MVFFSAATRHAGVLSSSRLLRASPGHLLQMLSWPGSFLSMFFLVFGDSIPKRCKGVDSETLQRSALCRSRRELSNEYVLSKFGFDAAENEPCKVCPLSAYRSPRCFGTPGHGYFREISRLLHDQKLTEKIYVVQSLIRRKFIFFRLRQTFSSRCARHDS